MITHVLSVSASEKRATLFALHAPSILPAVRGRLTQLAPAALQSLAALISPVAAIFPVTASLSVVAAHQIQIFPVVGAIIILSAPLVLNSKVPASFALITKSPAPLWTSCEYVSGHVAHLSTRSP